MAEGLALSLQWEVRKVQPRWEIELGKELVQISPPVDVVTRFVSPTEIFDRQLYDEQGELFSTQSCRMPVVADKDKGWYR